MIDESDDEEKQTLLAEENILQLEESEKARFPLHHSVLY